MCLVVALRKEVLGAKQRGGGGADRNSDQIGRGQLLTQATEHQDPRNF